MKIITRNFGEVTFTEDKIIYFEEGIPGFKELTKYILIEDTESMFEYLQSVEDGKISFIVINPYLLKKDYVIDIKDQYVKKLGGGEAKEFSVYTIVTILNEVENATVNLLAPIIIQNTTKKGMQVILENTTYTTKHKIMTLLEEGGC